jgi:predicted amidophosphoribosyltransferase
MDVLGAFLAPALCSACGSRRCSGEALLCPPCASRLAAAQPLRGPGPAGVERAWSSAPHEGVARELVSALKFRRLLAVADLMAGRFEALAPAWVLSGTIVPVPAAPLRRLLRGFDPAGEIAAALAARLGLPLATGCLARRGLGRQAGRSRAGRLGDPPHVLARGAAPASALLVDDVLTTGATLSACARALRESGSRRVVAVTFTRRL